MSVSFSSLALISIYVLFWKAIQHVQPEYFSKKTTCLAQEGRKIPIWNGRWSLGSGSVAREKSIRKGKTVKEQRQEKMKKEKNHKSSVDSSSVSFAQRKPFDPRPHYCRATTFAVFCIPVSFWSDLDWFCCSVLTLRRKNSQMFFTGWCDLTRRRTKWDRRGKSLKRGWGGLWLSETKPSEMARNAFKSNMVWWNLNSISNKKRRPKKKNFSPQPFELVR